MARAKDVRPGQVWTAKVSGKLTEVEVLGPAGVTPKGRTKFQWKNLRTGRTATGTAAKLRQLKREAPGPAMPPTQEQAVPPPAPKPKRRRRKPRQPHTPLPRDPLQGSGAMYMPPIETPFERYAEEVAAGYANPHPEAPTLPIAQVPAIQHPPPWGPTQLVQPNLPSLRGQGRPRRRRNRGNPARYPSPLAQRVCEEIARTDGREWSIRAAVDRVLGEAWAAEAGWNQY